MKILNYKSKNFDKLLDNLLLKRKKKLLLIGLAYSFQRIKSIPLNKYDKKLDFVVTERKIIE